MTTFSRCSATILAIGLSWSGVLSFALADGTYVKAGGGTVIPKKNRNVRMVWEEIDFDVQRPDLLDAGSDLIVSVRYLFRNDTKRPQNITMGFPVGWDFSEQYLQGEGAFSRSFHSPMSEFTTTIDGQPVPVELRPQRIREPREYIKDNGQEIEPSPHTDDPYDAYQYYLWPVTFAPQQERTIVNRYLYNTHSGIYWDANELVYILRSGAAWKGSIGRITIRFRFHDRGCVYSSGSDGPEACITQSGPLKRFSADPFVFSSDLSESSLPDGRWHTAADGSRGIVWQLKNVEPTDDIHFYYATAAYARNQILQLLRRLDVTKASVETLKKAYQTLLALYGKRLDDPNEQARFERRSWYHADPQITLAKISADPLYKILADALLKAALPQAAPKPSPASPASPVSR